MQPIDLLAYYREHLYKIAPKVQYDPDFCRIALEVCKDFLRSNRLNQAGILEWALFSVLKQARWTHKGLMRLAGPTWLSYDMAHSDLGPFQNRDAILRLAESIASTARHYQTQLFGDHSSASHTQRELKASILIVCIAIQRGMSPMKNEAAPRLKGNNGLQA